MLERAVEHGLRHGGGAGFAVVVGGLFGREIHQRLHLGWHIGGVGHFQASRLALRCGARGCLGCGRGVRFGLASGMRRVG